jgi:tape measure domain-containing protein
MSNIATLGFDIDTAPLRKANDELNKLVKSAAAAEKAADKAGSAGTQAGNAIASGMARAANAAQAAAAAMTGVGASANAAAAAARVATAQGRVASATAASAQATAQATAATGRYAQSSLQAANSNNILNASILGVHASTLLNIAALAKLGHEAAQAMDSYTQLGNAMKVAGLNTEAAAMMEDRLFQAAKKNGIAIDDLTSFYRRMAITQKEVGASNADVAQMVDVVSAALRVQGTSSKAAAGALLQLSQSFGSGKVKAEEFNSIQEGALPLLQAAANGIDKYKGSVAAMRQDVIAGNLSSKEFFEGILKGGGNLQQLAANTKLTLAGAFTAAGNSLVFLLGKMDETAGISKTVSGALETISGWLDKLAKDPDFLNGLASAFQAFVGIVGLVRSGLESVFMMLGGISERIKEIMREKAAADIREGGVTTNAQGEFVYKKGEDTLLMEMTQSAKAVDLAKAAMDRYKYSIDKAKESGGSVTGAMVKNLKDATAEWEEAWDVYRSQQGALEQLRVKALNARIGSPTEGSAVTSETMQFGPFLPPGWTDKPKGGVATGTGKHKGLDALSKIKIDAQQYIEKQNEMTKAIGLTDEAASKLMHTQELRAKFQDANYPIEIAWIEKTAAAMAKAEAEYKSASFWHDRIKAGNEFIAQQEIEYKTIGMSREAANAYRIEMTALLQAQREGKTVSAEQSAAWHENALAQAAAAEKVQRYAEAVSFAKELSKGFFDDMREGLLNGLSLWDTFGKAALNVLNRIASKIMDMAIDGIFDMVFSPGKSSSGGVKAVSGTGIGGGSSTGGIGSILGVLGGNGSASGGFWGSPIIKPSIDQEIAAWSSGGNVPWMNQISWGQGISAIGGLASAGMNFAKGGLGGTIGGIGNLVGAGVSLIPGIGQIAGPIIGVLSGILPSLFGEEKKAPPIARAQGTLSFTGGNQSVSGSETGGAQAVTGVLGDLAKVIKDLAESAGALKGVSSSFQGSIEYQTFQQGEFNNGTVYVNRPNGTRMQWGQSSDPKMIEHALDTAAANIAHHIITNSKSTGDIMREGLVNYGLKNSNYAFTTDELKSAISDLNTLQEAVKTFGKDLNPTEQALKGVNDSFDALKKIADEYKISASEVTKIEAERLRQQQKISSEFSSGLDKELMDPVTRALTEIGDERTDRLRTNSALMAIKGYTDQSLKIEEIYQKRRKEILDQAAQDHINALNAIKDAVKNAAKNAVTSINDVLKRLLPGGDLDNMNNAAHLAGLKATYSDLRTSAFNSNDPEIIQDYLEATSKFVEFAKEYGGGGKVTNSIRDQAIADLEALRQRQQQIADTGVVPANGNAPVPSGSVEKLMALYTKAMEENAELRALMTRLVAKMGA